MKMTNQEAREILSKHTVDMGKKSKQYAEAIELASWALEKQIPKKLKIVTEKGWDGNIIYPTCPNCDSSKIAETYCGHCGQRLDWSDEK